MSRLVKQTANFPEDDYFFERSGELRYPVGHKGNNRNTLQNLTTYREGIKYHKGTRVIKSDGLEFDIERHVSWDPRTYELESLTYSMMFNGRYPVPRLAVLGRIGHPTIEEFCAATEQLPGFVADLDSGLQPSFINHGGNLFTNWSVHNRRIGIGVIQAEPVPDLEVVTGEIIPCAVRAFNHLSPTWQITPELVRRSVELAHKAAAIIPKRR